MACPCLEQHFSSEPNYYFGKDHSINSIETVEVAKAWFVICSLLLLAQIMKGDLLSDEIQLDTFKESW